MSAGIDGQAVPDGLPFHSVSLASFLDITFPPLAWLVPNLVPARGVTLMCSPPNAGKTLLAFDYAAQAAAAGRRVLILEEEGSARGTQERLRRAAEAAGLLESEAVNNIEVAWNSGFSLRDIRSEHYLVERVKDMHIELVVMDSLAALCHGVDENDSAQMGLVGDALFRIQANSASGLLVLHHTTKESWKPGQTPTLASMRGHGMLAGRIDATLALVPMESPAGTVRFELYVLKQREGERAAPRQIEVLMTGPAAVVRQVQLSYDRPPTAAALRLAEATSRVLQVVPDDDLKSISANDVVDLLRLHKQTVLAAIRNLLLSGKLGQRGNGRIYRMKASVSTVKPSDSGRYNRFLDPRDPSNNDDEPKT